jgi:hypothetical protein
MASLPLKPTAARPGATVGVGSLLVGQVTQAHRDQLNGLECGCECVCEVGEFGGARIAHVAGAAARLLKAGYCGVDRSAFKRDARIADRVAEVREPVCGWRRRLRRSSVYLYGIHLTKLSMGLGRCVRPFFCWLIPPWSQVRGSWIQSRAVARFAWWRATATPEPIPKIGCKNASPARREFNDGRSFAERDQTLERAASEAGDGGSLIVGVDSERGLPAQRCGVTPCVSSEACRTLRQDAHPFVRTRNYTTDDDAVSWT